MFEIYIEILKFVSKIDLTYDLCFLKIKLRNLISDRILLQYYLKWICYTIVKVPDSIE